MRKVLSFVLVLSLVLGSFGMAFAAPLSDMAGEKNEEAATVLSALGVITGYPDGTFKPDRVVTRAEMAVIIVNALGFKDYASGTANYSDMAGHWSNPYVAYATSLGILAGYPDGTFKPDQTVSYDEAARILVSGIGYSVESLVGNWPANFVTKAKTLGILDGIKSGPAGAVRGDIAEMVYNSLDLDLGYTNKNGEWVANSELTFEAFVRAWIEEDEAALKIKLDNMLVRLGAEYSVGVIYGDEDSAINLRPYVGGFGTAYGIDDEIICVILDSVFLSGEYNEADGVFEADNGTDYKVSAKVANTYTEGFFNGEWDDDDFYLDDWDADETVTIAVKLSGKTITKVYSVNEWTVDADEMFVKADAADISEDEELFNFDFYLNDDDEIDLNSFELVGADSLDKIEVDNVVYVYVDSDAMIRKIVVGTEKVEGEITKIASNGKYTIGGKVYELVSDANVINADIDGLLKPGDEVVAYLDGFGYIYDLSGVKSTKTYAVSLQTGNGGPDLGDGPALAKLFLADGTHKVFDVSTKVVGSDNIWDAGQAAADGSIVKYSVNKDGKVDSYDNLEDPGEKVTVADGNITAKGYFDGVAIASDAAIFIYAPPTGADPAAALKDEDNYKVTKLSNVLDTKDVDASYVVDGNKIVVMLITAGVGVDSVYGVITDYAENNSDAGYEVSALVDGKAVVYDSKQEGKAADKSYLAEFKFDADSDVVKEYAEVAIVPVEVVITKIEGSVVKAGDTAYSLDSNVVVYTWNGSKFVVGSVRDMDDEGYKVKMYDTDDTADKVYDIVLVVPGV